MEEFLENNQKLILIGVIAVVLAGVAYVFITGLDEKAQEEAGNALMTSTDDSGLSAVITDHAGSNAAGTAHLLLADSLWKADDKAGAIEKLRGFLSTFPEHAARPSAQAKLGSFLLRNGKPAEAKSVLEDLVSSPEGDYVAPFALRILGDIAKSEGDIAAAKEFYSRSSGSYKDRFNPRIINQSQVREGLVEFEAPVEVDPPAPEPAPSPVAPSAPAIPITPAATEPVTIPQEVTNPVQVEEVAEAVENAVEAAESVIEQAESISENGTAPAEQPAAAEEEAPAATEE